MLMRSNRKREKKPGVWYAQTVEGLELPIIDITNPVFRVEEPGKAEMEALIIKMNEDEKNFNQLPDFLRRFFLWVLSRRSFLMRNLLSTSTTYLSGMNTYLLKLGPDNLGKQYSKPFDKKIASSLPGLSARLRLQDMASMAAGAITPVLSKQLGASLQIINIAGGPCADSLNLLLLLKRKNPESLDGRVVTIRVLDLEKAAPVFAGRALEALKSSDAPLYGVNASLEYTPYDWREAQQLGELLKAWDLNRSIVVVMAEGGLFDYGTTGEITSNLKVLHAFTPNETVLVGTFTPHLRSGEAFARVGGARTVARTSEEVADLASRSGWKIVESKDRFINYVVRMEKA